MTLTITTVTARRQEPPAISEATADDEHAIPPPPVTMNPSLGSILAAAGLTFDILSHNL